MQAAFERHTLLLLIVCVGCTQKADLACGSMVLDFFLYVVFSPAGEKTTYKW
jgi:hypothetical protein